MASIEEPTDNATTLAESASASAAASPEKPDLKRKADELSDNEDNSNNNDTQEKGSAHDDPAKDTTLEQKETVNGGDGEEGDNEEGNDNGNDNDDKTKPEEEEEEIEHPLVTKFVFDGVEYPYKERPAVIEERKGIIEFRVVNNDDSKEHLIILMGLKNIFQKQLPKMPREYISRLVFDKSHVSIAVIRKPLTVVGGVTIRPFESRGFAEIVFCAISSNQQVKGYGAHMMNHLKDYVKATSKVKHFLTYADNYAIGYFRKQGFTKEITLERSIWIGYIKDYEGGTIMQCTMLPKIRYLDSSKILLVQKAAIARKIRQMSKSQIVRPGLAIFRDPNFQSDREDGGIDPLTIPGIKESGWSPEMDALARQPKRSPHFAAMQQILSAMQMNPSAWPFSEPVNRQEVPDYYEFIKEPMALSTMEEKLDADLYTSLEQFIYDARLIFNNCRSYNSESTNYYKNANKLEKFFEQKVREYPEYAHLLD